MGRRNKPLIWPGQWLSAVEQSRRQELHDSNVRRQVQFAKLMTKHTLAEQTYTAMQVVSERSGPQDGVALQKSFASNSTTAPSACNSRVTTCDNMWQHVTTCDNTPKYLNYFKCNRMSGAPARMTKTVRLLLGSPEQLWTFQHISTFSRGAL